MSHMSLTTWAKNFAGMSVSDEEMRSIPSPLTELSVHVTFKTTEAGAVVGPMMGIFFRAALGPRTVLAIQHSAVRLGIAGYTVGLLAGTPLVYYYSQKKQLDTEQLYDRAFRLRANTNQLNVDRASGLLAVVGGALAGFRGILFGINVGIASATLWNSNRK